MEQDEDCALRWGDDLAPTQLQRSNPGGLRICALGRLRVHYGQTPLHFPTKKTQDLLCLLLFYAGQPLERDVIAERLWPMHPPGKALRSLSTALWRLRQALQGIGDEGQTYILAEGSTLSFNTAAAYWYDARVFERRASFGLAGSLPCEPERRQALEEALELYVGDLLADCYDDWCLAERERLRLLLLRALKHLQCDYRLCGAYEAAIACGTRLLALDPLQEDVHRELMRCYAESGQRPLALEQFQRCRETLRQELEIEPMSETWAVYRRIRADQEFAQSPPGVEDRRRAVQTALAQVRRTLEALESTWQALQIVNLELVEGDESPPGQTAYPETG